MFHKRTLKPDRYKLLKLIDFDWGETFKRGPLPFGNRSLCGDESTLANDSIQVPKNTSMRRLQKINRSSNNTIPQNIASISFASKNLDGEYDDFEFEDDEVDNIDNNDDDDKNDDDNVERKPAATHAATDANDDVKNITSV